MDYVLIRSRRKTLSIRLLAGGILEVRAPLRLPQKRIEEFLALKADWIEEHRKFCPPAPEVLSEGAMLPFLGKEYPIVLNPALPAKIAGDCLRLPLAPGSSEAEIRQAAEKFYRSQAKILLPPLIRELSEKLGVRCSGFHITGAKTRWGSCSARASLNFSWRLMAAPPEEIRMVTAHELCHLIEFNHSPAFYAQLARVCPQWKRESENLKNFRGLCW